MEAEINVDLLRPGRKLWGIFFFLSVQEEMLYNI